MTRTRLRGKTARASMWETPSKALVEAELESVGAKLVFARENVGAWNERRCWFFEQKDGTRVDTFCTTFKGDRTDWGELMQEACKLTGVPFGN